MKNRILGTLAVLWAAMGSLAGCDGPSPYEVGQRVGQLHVEQIQNGTLDFETWMEDMALAKKPLDHEERERFMDGYNETIEPVQVELLKLVSPGAGKIAGEITGELAEAFGDGLGEMMKHMGRGLGEMLVSLEDGAEEMAKEIEAVHEERRTTRRRMHRKAFKRRPVEVESACDTEALEQKEEALRQRAERILEIEMQLRAREKALSEREAALEGR